MWFGAEPWLNLIQLLLETKSRETPGTPLDADEYLRALSHTQSVPPEVTAGNYFKICPFAWNNILSVTEKTNMWPFQMMVLPVVPRRANNDPCWFTFTAVTV